MVDQVLQDLIVLTGYSEEDAALLREHASLTRLWADEAVQVFYDTLFGYERTAAVFREGERPEREKTLRDWYLRVVSGEIDPQFWRWQWLAGVKHIPRHVTNAFMLGAMSRLQQFFLEKCLEALPVEEARRLYRAFHRVTGVAVGVMTEGYFQNYVVAMEKAVGFNRALVERMMELEIQQMIDEAQEEAQK